MSVKHNPTSLDFTPFHIFSACGHQYAGVRPSLISKPFQSAVVVLEGRAYHPGLPDNYSQKQVLGYDAALRVGINVSSSGELLEEDRAYRLITIMADGKKWSKLIYLNGNIKEGWL